MMELVAEDPDQALRAEGLLAAANRAGILQAADVHVAQTLSTLVAEPDPAVVLALALAVRAVRRGSVCLDLHGALTIPAEVPDEDDDREWSGRDGGATASAGCDAEARLASRWPTDADAWLRAVEDSALCRSGVLRVEFGLIYLDRYHQEELRVARLLRERVDERAPRVDAAALEVSLGRLFAAATFAEQRAAADRAARQWTTVLTGGPGTGKTSTVARVLVLLDEQWELAGHTRPMRVALAAPTGKAAARLKESVAQAAAGLAPADADRIRELDAMTLHRLLGWRHRGTTGFRFNAGNRLPHDVIVVDETSMVALTMMSRLLQAVRPTSRLVLVGDADQLASVDAGAVMADLVDGYQRLAPETVCRLTTSHRFDAEIGALAAAVRDGHADQVVDLLRAGGSLGWIDDDDPAPALRGPLVQHALRLRERALAGDAAGALAVLGEHRLLCARRTGPRGVRTWNHLVDEWLSEATGDPLWDPMYAGRPILVTRNDYTLAVHNGDTGVVMGGSTGPVTAQIGTAAGPVPIAASRLSDIETMHAMTIHKSQGSEAGEVTVLLPDGESPLLTRELLYTAITRARRRVTIVGSEETVRTAVTAHISRATGLRLRLANPFFASDGLPAE